MHWYQGELLYDSGIVLGIAYFGGISISSALVVAYCRSVGAISKVVAAVVVLSSSMRCGIINISCAGDGTRVVDCGWIKSIIECWNMMVLHFICHQTYFTISGRVTIFP